MTRNKQAPKARHTSDMVTPSAHFNAQNLDTVIHNAPIAIALVNRFGEIDYGNASWHEEGWPSRWTLFEQSDRKARHEVRGMFVQVLRGETVTSRTTQISPNAKKPCYARWALRPRRMQDGNVNGAVLYVKDVTSEIQAQNLANERQAFFEAVLNNINEAVIACDAEGNIKYSNPRLSDYVYESGGEKGRKFALDEFVSFKGDGVTRLGREDLPLRRALDGQSVRRMPLVYMTDANTKKYVEATAQQIIDEDGTLKGAVSSLYEVTDRIEKERQLKRSEAEARRIAYSDALTGYPNRASLQRTLKQDFSQLCEDGERVVVLSIDIRRFKSINDIHGQKVGDALLAEAADRMADVAGPRAILGRLAGDEFLLISPVAGDMLMEIAQNISHIMDGQHVIDGHRLNVQMIIGAAVWPDDGFSGDELLKRADMARRDVKRSSITTMQRFTSAMEDAANSKRQIEQDLRKTIQNDGLDVAYQAIVDAQSGAIKGFEALCRWHHPEQGFIAPDQFIAVAEQTGDILDLGEWILRKVMADLVEYPGYFVAVNVSPLQFSDTQFVPRLKDALVEFDFDPSRLEIEVTENLVVHDPEQVVSQIRELQALGVRVALDDFGTGYSSLAYLQTYQFDKLKIDRTFVNKLGQDREALALVQCMIQMGKAMRMTVVAEGIETEGQALMLRHAGCDCFQGYFYAKPEPWEKVLETHLNQQPDTAPNANTAGDGRPVLVNVNKAG